MIPSSNMMSNLIKLLCSILTINNMGDDNHALEAYALIISLYPIRIQCDNLTMPPLTHVALADILGGDACMYLCDVLS